MSQQDNPFLDKDFGASKKDNEEKKNPFSDPDFAIKDKGVGGLAKDAALSLGSGLAKTPEALVGVADTLVGGGRIGKAIDDHGFNYGEQLSDYLESKKTDLSKIQQEGFANAGADKDTFGGKVGAKLGFALKNPSMVVNEAVRSIPDMVVGSKVAKAIPGGNKLNPVVRGAAGEGIMMTGHQAEEIRQENEDKLLTPKQRALAALTGVSGGVISLLGGVVAKHLKIADVDTLIASGIKPSEMAAHLANMPSKSIPKSIIHGMIQEGLLEELPQETVETILGNLATDKHWAEGLEDAVVMAPLAGMLMGGTVAGTGAALRGKQQAGPSEDDDALLGGEHPEPQAPTPNQPEAAPFQHEGMTPPPVPEEFRTERPSQRMGLNPDDGALSAAAAKFVDHNPEVFAGQFVGREGTNNPMLEHGGDFFSGNVYEGQLAEQPEPQKGLGFRPRNRLEGPAKRPALPFDETLLPIDTPVYNVDSQGKAMPGSNETADSMRLRVDPTQTPDLRPSRPAKAQQQQAEATPEQQAKSAWDSMNTFERNNAASKVLGKRGVLAKNAAATSWDKLHDNDKQKLIAGLDSHLGTRWTDPNQKSSDREMTVLQNRDRSNDAMIGQMRSIAAKPDYNRVSFSRDFGNGAPVVEDSRTLPEQQLGNQDIAVTSAGRQIPVQYAAIEADQLLASNHADGSPIAEYANGVEGMNRAIAGNGRVAGLTAAWNEGNAEAYKQSMLSDASHGIDPATIEAMSKPVLVRLMPQDEVTADIGDESNIAGQSGLSSVEQANTDMRRVDLGNLSFDGNDEVTIDSVLGFIRSMPQSEQNELLDGNQPSRAAIDRFEAALFQQAYGNNELTSIQAGANRGEARTIMAGLMRAAPAMSKLEGAGEFDIRPLVSEAATVAVNARRAGVSLPEYIKQHDAGRNPEIEPILEMLAEHNGNAKEIGEKLTSLARLAYAESNKGGVDLFGEVTKATPDQLMKVAFKGEQIDVSNNSRPQDLGQQSRPRPDAQSNEQPEADSGRPEESAGAVATIEQPEAGQQDDFNLASETEAEREAREKAEAEAKAKQEAEQKLDKKNAQADADLEGFTLTGSNSSADIAMAHGQNDIFADQPKENVNTGRKGTQQERDEAFSVDNPDNQVDDQPSVNPDDFITAPDGSIDFGEINQEVATAIGRQAGKIRLQQGDGTWGLSHIEERRGDEIRKAGFGSVQEFVGSIAKNIEEIWRPEKTRQLVAIHSERKHMTMFVELQPAKDESGDFYTVKTAYASKNKGKKSWNLLWERRANLSDDSSDHHSFAGQTQDNAGEKATNPKSQSNDSSVAQETTIAQELPAILTLSKKQYLKNMAKERGYKAKSPGYADAMAAIEQDYETELDSAFANLPFNEFNRLNPESGESVNRAAWEALREEHGLPVTNEEVSVSKNQETDNQSGLNAKNDNQNNKHEENAEEQAEALRKAASLEKRFFDKWIESQGITQEQISEILAGDYSRRTLFAYIGKNAPYSKTLMEAVEASPELLTYYLADHEAVKALSSNDFNIVSNLEKKESEKTNEFAYAVLKGSNNSAELDYIKKLGPMANRFRIGSQAVGGKLWKMAQPYLQEQRSEKNAETKPENAESALESQIKSMSMDDISAMFDDVAQENNAVETSKPKAKRSTKGQTKEGKPRPKPKVSPAEKIDNTNKEDTSRTAKEIAKSMGANLNDAGLNALDGLAKLFGGNGTLNSGLGFNEETYAKAKPHFIQAAKATIEAGKDLRDLIKALVSSFGDGIKPYVLRFTEDIKSGTINLTEGAENVSSTNRPLEQGSTDAVSTAATDNVESTTESDTGDTTRPDGRAPVLDPREDGLQQPVAESLFSGSPIASDERANIGINSNERHAATKGSTTRSDDNKRGSDTGFNGVPTESVATTAVIGSASERLRVKQEKQRQAEGVPVKQGNLENIRQTLPYLLPAQQEDVHKIEKRFAVNNGYGMLLTNGTGTGKTFSGLGLVKRYVKEGKSNVLILVPDHKVASDWIKSGKPLGLDITQLKDTNDAGKGVTVTLYANAGANSAIAQRNWDLVIADEAHNLMASSQAKATKALDLVRTVTFHTESAYARRDRLNPNEAKRIAEVRKRADEISRQLSQKNINSDFVAALEKERAVLNAEWEQLDKVLLKALEGARKQIEDNQGEKRPRLLALTATPFSYVETIDWANEYLFDYNEGKPKDTFHGYNQGNNRDQFIMANFGYRMRNNRLTRPDANVDVGLMERQFNEMLRKNGALSGRSIDVEFDYDRRFMLIESAIGRRIDEALDYIRENNNHPTADFSGFGENVRKAFSYLERRYLLEAIKAEAAIPIVKQHLAMGRKVVVFHDYKKGGSTNPFVAARAISSEDAQKLAFDIFAGEFPDLANPSAFSLPRAVDQFTSQIPEVLIANGDESQKAVLDRYKKFQADESGPQVLLVQSAKSAGWSGHDTTGKHQRVLINLGQPTTPASAIQQEGRIYRVGQASNAIIRYMNTGTNWERTAFAETIAGRSSTVENMAMGNQARALKQSFIDAFEDADLYEPGHANEGMGGKEIDRARESIITPYDEAKSYYYGQGKRNSSTKSAEGVDYFATPEPVGLKMTEWLGLNAGESSLEPSAGHGAIARWLPESTRRTFVEPSNQLRSRLSLLATANDKIVDSNFEDLNIINKFDGIAMNPPFGRGGKLAAEHVGKAIKHLREGGRIVALIPEGPAADRQFEKLLSAEENANVFEIASIHLPSVTFERAGTKVATKIIVLEKRTGDEAVRLLPNHRRLDFRSTDNINELFDDLENVSFEPRAGVAKSEQTTTEKPKASNEGEATTGFESFEKEHTKTGETLYLVKPTKRLEYDEYKDVLAKVKEHGGFWDKFSKGFRFESEQKRQEFLDQNGAVEAFLRRGATNSQEITNGELNAKLKEIAPNLKQGKDIHIFNNVNELFAKFPAVEREAKRQGSDGSDIDGVNYKGTILIVKDKVKDAAHLETILAHEGTHGGIKAMMKDAGFNKAAGALWREIGGAKGFIDTMNKLGLQDKLKPYLQGVTERLPSGAPKLTREQRNEILMQELFAFMGENTKPSIKQKVQAFIGSVRAWLRKHGLIGMARLSTADLLHMANKAREFGLKQTGADSTNFLRAYHGSQHNFNAFDLSAIGSGTGSQTYGWGLYFSSNKALADWYKTANGEDGATYQVDIPEASEMLNYDRPLGEHAEPVRMAVRRIERDLGMFVPSLSKMAASREFYDHTGEDIYRAMAKDLGSDEHASRMLGDYGIPGMTYSTNDSRYVDGSESAENYVVWNDALIEIEESTRYGVSARRRHYNKNQLDLFEELKKLEGVDPYDHTKQREGTTEEQKRLGRSALTDFFRWLTNYSRREFDRDDRSKDGLSILGASIYKGFKEGKPQQLVGKKITSPADLAALAQVYRDPRFETFRVFYTDNNNKVVLEEAVTTRMPASVYFEGESFEGIGERAKKAGASKVYLLHNHPSGNPTPSNPDKNITIRLANSLGDTFAGHVVIDHNQYAHIDGNGKHKIFDAPELAGIDYLKNPEVPNKLLGETIDSQQSLAMIGKQLPKSNHPIVIITKPNQTVGLIASVPMNLLEQGKDNYDGSKRSTAFVAAIRRLIRAAGVGGNMFVVLPENADTKADYQWMHTFSQDVIDSNGNSLIHIGGNVSIDDFAAVTIRSGQRLGARERPIREDEARYLDDRPHLNKHLKDQTETKEFKKWFGDSKVVDLVGFPQIVYRGLTKEYSPDVSNSLYTWVTNDKDLATAYAEGGEPLALYARAETPLDLNYRTINTEVKRSEVYERLQDAVMERFKNGDLSSNESKTIVEEIQDERQASTDEFKPVWQWLNDEPKLKQLAEKAGFDSIKADEGIGETFETFGLFNPQQAKSATDNSGDFSSDNDNIMFSRRQGKDPEAKTAERIQKAVDGKSVHEVADYIIANAENKAQRVIAQKVAEKLKQLEQSGVNFNFEVTHLGSQAPQELNYSRGFTEFIVDDKGNINTSVFISGTDMAGRVGMDNETILHELIHAATGITTQLGRINPKSEHAKHLKDLGELQDAVIEHLISRREELGEESLTQFEKDIIEQRNNATLSEDEILAWGLTNPEMQQYMESIPYKSSETIWGKFVSLIRDLLGLPASEQTALSELLRVAEHILEADPFATKGTKNVSKHGSPLYSTQQTADRWGMSRMEMSRAEAVAAKVHDFAEKMADKADGWTNKNRAVPSNWSDAQKAAASKFDTFTPRQPFASRLRQIKEASAKRFMQLVFDQFNPLRDLSQKAFMQAHLSRGAEGSVEAIATRGVPYLRDGAISVKADENGFMGKLAKLGDMEEIRKFLMWVTAQRAKQLMAEGRENLFTEEDLAGMDSFATGKLKDGRIRRIEYGNTLKELNKYNKAVLDIAQQAGLVNAEARASWESDFYIPFYRVMQNEDGSVSGKFSHNDSGLMRQEVIKRLKGGKENLGDPLENILSNWSNLIAASMKNMAANEALIQGVELGISAPSEQKFGNQLWTLQNGERVYWDVHDKHVLEALESLNFNGYQNGPMKAAGKFKRMLTMGVTVSPTFRIRSLIRDTLHGMAVSDIGYNPIANAVNGWKLSGKDSETLTQMIAGGGAIRFGSMEEGQSSDYMRRMIRQGAITPDQILDTPSKFRNALNDFYNSYQELGDKMESVNRAVIYERVLEKTGSHLEASFAARDVMNYTSMGSAAIIRAMAQVLPFFNARMQGLNKLVRGANEDPRRFWGVVGTIGMASAALYLMQAGDDEYDELPDYVRDTYWPIKLGDKWLYIPKPFEVGVLGTVVERFTELMFSDGDYQANDFKNTLTSLLINNLSLNPVPQILLPAGEAWLNYDSFRGSQIDNMAMQRLLPEDRYNANTSAGAVGLGKLLGASPQKIEHLINGYFGWLGVQALNVSDLLGRSMIDMPASPRRDMTQVNNWFMAGDFLKEQGSTPSKYSNRFYEVQRDLNQKYATANAARREGNMDRYREIMSRPEMKARPMVAAANNRITKINQQIRRIVADKGLSASQKTERLKVLYERREAVAKTVDQRARAS